jgi:dienelactone hydrolase
MQVGSLAGFDAYFAEPKEQPKAAILLITDIFGWEVKNVRIIADKYADAGKLSPMHLCLTSPHTL